MSIFARKTAEPAGKSPLRIASSNCKFSSTVLSRYGEFSPGAVNEPRLNFMSSADWLST